MAFEQATTVLRQRDGTIVLVQRHSADESLLFQVPNVERVVPRITQVAFRHDPKGADRRERPRFGSVQCVVAVAVVHQLALWPAWQIHVPHEHIAGINASAVTLPIPWLTVPFLAPVVVALADVLVPVADCC
jgi:hypothetical protein